ncbi:MAG TPA: flagellar basal body P-ring formation chaperone FlgA [archaeon]|nr:flagellar basal body P-ring formation chaperone FlgA [archaeon]
MKSIFLSLALAAVLLSWGAKELKTASDDKVYIYLKSTAQTNHGQLVLGDVAQVEGFNEELISMLTELPLGPAPVPGESLTIDKAEIRRSMVAHRIDPVKVALAGEDSVEVSRSGSLVSAAELTNLAEEYVKRCWQGEPVRTEIIYSRLPEDFNLTAENYELEVLTPVNPKVTGSFALSVAAVKNSQVLVRVPVSLKVRAYQNVAVMNKSIRQSEIISPEDFDFAEQEITGMRGTPVTSAEQAAGKRLKRSIKESQILTFDYLETMPLIERGDEVILIVKYKNIRIGCAGKAWQKGRLGDKILVRNQYGKNLMGQVMDSHTVLITP